MFSATKVVGIAAAAALFAVLLLAVPPNPQPTDPLPADAQLEVSGTTPFTGEMRILGQDRAANIERYEWGNSMPGEQWSMRLTSNDPRMSGVGTAFHNAYEVGPAKSQLRTMTGRLFAREGTWYQTAHGYQDPETTGFTYVSHSVGEGAYEGLTAIHTCGQEKTSGNWDCHGLIFEGEWPEFPADAPSEMPAIHLGP